MVRQSVQFEMNELRLRILSALVMLPLASVAIYFGGWIFVALIVVMTASMSLEWLRICGIESRSIRTIMVSFVATAPVLALIDQFDAAWVFIVLGMLVGLIRKNTINTRSRIIAAFGIPYIGATGIVIVWLRCDPVLGLETVFWLFCVVIATDSAGYFVGRIVGGPKLFPRISPKKTWSGLSGGVVAASVVGVFTVNLTDQSAFIPIILICACIAIVAQAGDFIESGLKRYFSVKDASNIIPGHGGVLDRLDGFLTATPFVAFLTWFHGSSPLM